MEEREPMILDQTVEVAAPVDRVWEFMMDIPAVSRCVPGVESFTAVDEDTYEGALKVKVGPIGVKLQGRVVVAERDREALRSRLDVSAAEKRIASTVNAKSTMTLVPIDDDRTELHIHTDASVLGKLGEFGQAVMRKKADQVMAEFARNVSATLST
jgi:carbon monoxide dehydrogenase subunit G